MKQSTRKTEQRGERRVVDRGNSFVTGGARAGRPVEEGGGEV